MTDQCNKESLVTVVVPVFNRSKLILSSLESVRHQLFRPLEIIVVDDGSTDDTVKVVQKWIEQFNIPGRFSTKCITQKKNQGANAARNRGIEEATGEFVAFLDSDDLWMPQKLKKQIPALKLNPSIGGIYCGLRHFDINTQKRAEVGPKNYPEGYLLRQLLIQDITEPTSCWVVRKECFKKTGLFDITLPARQDWDMWIRLATHFHIGSIPEILVEQGGHTGERVRSDPQREIDAHQTIFEKYAYLRTKFAPSVSLAARAAMYRRRGRVYFHRGISKKSALKLQCLAIIIWPFAFDSYAALAGMFLPKNFRQNMHVAWNRIFGKTRFSIKAH
ncbi:MAG: glycosyltransferase family A protein [Candidatus Electrothrix aestuarii]|uniref:Glycosyltransferase family A protein n=1 Tax=Candidatus Electrothrix aestuarii TaxID=3062594 RepID=A0AAU8LY54_9BACT|nr:glycosyltransferase family A protein [Candidatus Electrothrix aestuarii]